MTAILGQGFAYGHRVLAADLGGMRESVVLKSVAATSDTGGYKSATPTAVATVAAEVRPIDGTEPYQASALRAIGQYEVRIRYRSDVQAKWQIVWNGLTLEILGRPVNRDGRKRFLWLTCGVVGS